MKVEIPSTFAMCPNCGTVLPPDIPAPQEDELTFSVISSGNPQKCSKCGLTVVPEAHIVSELPKLTTLLEATCPNENCLAFYHGSEHEYSKCFGCKFCGSIITYPQKTVTDREIDIFTIIPGVRLSTPIGSPIGSLLVTKVGLVLLVAKIADKAIESTLPENGGALAERIQVLRPPTNENVVKKLLDVDYLWDLKKRVGFWGILDEYPDLIRISPRELDLDFGKDEKGNLILPGKVESKGSSKLKTNYGTLAFTVNPNFGNVLARGLMWFRWAAEYFCDEWDAMFFEPAVKYHCECGKIFRAYPAAVGETVICSNCGRIFKFRYRTENDVKREINIGLKVPSKIVLMEELAPKKKVSVGLCTACDHWTWNEPEKAGTIQECKHCSAPVQIMSEPSDWISHKCPGCSKVLHAPRALGGADVECKYCGYISKLPIS